MVTMEVLCRHYSTGTPVRVKVDETAAYCQWAEVGLEQLTGCGLGSDDLFLAPGLVDLQINGYCGIDFNRPKDLELSGIAKVVAEQRRLGVAYFLPTVTTGSQERMCKSLRIIAHAMQDREIGGSLPGIHLEGPYISREDGPRGAHPLADTRPPNWDEFQQMQEAARGGICIVTLSPEYPEAVGFIKRLVNAKVIAAIGHTNATEEQIKAAVDAGALLSTHLGNGSHAMVPRHSNYIWTQLAQDRLWASMIADSFHLPPDVFKSMVRCKTPERTVLVSDAVSVAGLPSGRYQTLGMDVELFPQGVVRLTGTPYLAGSALNLLRAIPRAAQMAEVPLATAIDMASLQAARLLAMGTTVGLEPLSRGTFSVLRRDREGSLEAVLLAMDNSVVHHQT